MVRTKISRNTASKRNRTSYQEERYANIMREFEIISESFIVSIDAKLNIDLEKIDRNGEILMSRIPKEFHKMTMGDLRKSGCNVFVNLRDKHLVGDGGRDVSPLSVRSSDARKNSIKSSKTDDGYQTEDCSKLSIDVLASAKPPGRPMGPLASAMKTSSRRRSNSVSSNAMTPSKAPQSSLLFGLKTKKTDLRTPGVSRSIFANQSDRMSRPKLRTPMVQMGKVSRPHTVSTDRGMSQITLKVEPNTPLAFIRHPRAGESVYSLTGSPVVNSVMHKNMANVNIPVPNGVLSLQPTDMDDVDPEALPPIDHATLEHLKKLQTNLNKIMKYAEDCNFRMHQ
ncbi:borealin-like [Anopheles ziemanni]|uniref:borealin-like n=1 Tax=Anopheles coustani TaxID=139045 RepID=UPI0026586786|nr:borealin-like [Anopheles coustani]XP_058171924.1 borealin-like [Anopheles ziemanni]